jgi:hypothetical protein
MNVSGLRFSHILNFNTSQHLLKYLNMQHRFYVAQCSPFKLSSLIFSLVNYPSIA